MAETKSDGWTEVGGSQQTPTWKYQEQKEIVGVYKRMQMQVGPNKSNMYFLEQKDGSEVGVWGTSLLDDRFAKLEAGTEVKIVYQGKSTSPKTGRSYHNFSIYQKGGE